MDQATLSQVRITVSSIIFVISRCNLMFIILHDINVESVKKICSSFQKESSPRLKIALMRATRSYRENVFVSVRCFFVFFFLFLDINDFHSDIN